MNFITAQVKFPEASYYTTHGVNFLTIPLQSNAITPQTRFEYFKHIWLLIRYV